MLKNNGFHNRHSPFSRPFSPASFFANGEQGWWYDPSNFATLFQDSAGTTPVTAVEQPVGLQLDLSKGLVLGPELVTNGDFSNGTTGWSALSGTWSVSGGRLKAANADSIKRYAQSTSAMVAGRWYKITWNQYAGAATGAANWTIPGVFNGSDNLANSGNYVNGEGEKTVYFFAPVSGQFYLYNFEQEVEYDNISVKELPGNHRFQTTSANRPVVSARVNLFVGTATLATQSVTTRATTHTLTFAGAGSITLSGTATGTFNAGTHSVTTTAGTLTATVLGTVTQADLRETNVGVGLPAYQAVVTSTNYDSTGFPIYIKPNGSNQFMQTNSINFTTTDKMTVWSGLRKLSVAGTVAMFTELSTSSDGVVGTFAIAAPVNAKQYYFQLTTTGAGRIDGSVSSGYDSPRTDVVTYLMDIGGASTASELNARINGSNLSLTYSGSGNGTGNFGNEPTYFYMRAGSSLPFNGNDYGSIARGAASTAAQITNGETYINSKTKAYTP